MMRRISLGILVPLALLLAGCHVVGPEHFVVFFAPKSSALDSQAKDVLATVATKAKQRPGVSVEVAGFSAPVGGSIADNQKLAAQRAQVVVDTLVADGVDAKQIRHSAIGGVDFSMDSVESRRVEITLGEN